MICTHWQKLLVSVSDLASIHDPWTHGGSHVYNTRTLALATNTKCQNAIAFYNHQAFNLPIGSTNARKYNNEELISAAAPAAIIELAVVDGALLYFNNAHLYTQWRRHVTRDHRDISASCRRCLEQAYVLLEYFFASSYVGSFKRRISVTYSACVLVCC